jgi:hypothetical protein
VPYRSAFTARALLLLALLLLPEWLALLLALLAGLQLRTALLLGERLTPPGQADLARRSGLARCSDAYEFLQPGFHVALAVVRLVGDPLNEVVDVPGGVEICGADLAELVENLVADLPPVLPQLLFDLLRLLLVHVATSLACERTGRAAIYAAG